MAETSHEMLTNLRVDDWLVIAEGVLTGKTYYVITEFWPEWGEDGSGPDSAIPAVLNAAEVIPPACWLLMPDQD